MNLRSERDWFASTTQLSPPNVNTKQNRKVSEGEEAVKKIQESDLFCDIGGVSRGRAVVEGKLRGTRLLR